MQNIRYVHTNIVSRDWQALARFYMDVFGCTLLPPERHLSGEWIESMTGIPGVKVDGVHLLLPGYENGPTLEIFSFRPEHTESELPKINRPGFAHIAFHVEDVHTVLEMLMEHGGGQLGEVIIKDYETLGRLTAVYARDPEGNLIEIQNWRK